MYFNMPRGPGPVLKFCELIRKIIIPSEKPLFFPSNFQIIASAPHLRRQKFNKRWAQRCTVKGKKEKKIQTEMIESLKI